MENTNKQSQINIMKDQRGYLTEPQVVKILEITKKVSFRNYLFLRTLWETGGRVSEILRLRKKDIDWDSEEIVMDVLKRRTPMIKLLPIPKSFLAELKKYTHSMDADTMLFPFGRAMGFYLVRKYGAMAGIPKVGTKGIHPHHFRHSFAILRARKGIPITITKELLGHDSIQSTATYEKFYTEDIKELLKKKGLL